MLSRGLAVSSILTLTIVTFAGRARADDPASAFSRAGHLAVSNDADVSFTNTSSSQSGSKSVTQLTLQPAADYFVIDNVSVGGVVPFQHTFGDASSTTIGLGVRGGYNFAFTDQLSIWPRAGFTFTSRSETVITTAPGGMTQSTSVSNSHLSLNVFAPFLYHPALHFFLGIGPEFNIDLTGDDPKYTTIGLAFIVGGWFLGD